MYFVSQVNLDRTSGSYSSVDVDRLDSVINMKTLHNILVCTM